MSLWLGVYFPELPLALAGNLRQPLAVIVEQRGAMVIMQANATAQALGVTAGLRLEAALALATELVTPLHNVEAEQQALQRLAAAALGYTDVISLEPPRGLLLNIAASLRLFGGLTALNRRLRRDLRVLGHRTRLGVAPTPAAATLFSLYGGGVSDDGELVTALADLPVTALTLSERQRQGLAALGVTTLGALCRLPRSGLRRRFGVALLEQLERLLGERPDPRQRFQPEPQLRASLDLAWPVDSVEPLLFALRRLLAELAAGLRAQDRLIDALELQFLSASEQRTTIKLSFAQATRDADYWLLLLRERLASTSLPAATTSLTIRAERLRPSHAATADLFDPGERDNDAELCRLAERLQARLGTRAVGSLTTRDDHRPERAWERLALGRGASATDAPNTTASQTSTSTSIVPARPLWLRHQPLALPSGPPPSWQLRGPERIETGWWDGGDGDVSRDYYRARTPDGRQLWLFQQRRGERRWFIHGYFS